VTSLKVLQHYSENFLETDILMLMVLFLVLSAVTVLTDRVSVLQAVL
jgi:hypothetical protein